MQTIHSTKNHDDRKKENQYSDDTNITKIKNNFLMKDKKYRSNLEKIIEENRNKDVENYIRKVIKKYIERDINSEELIDELLIKNKYVYNEEHDIYFNFLSKNSSIFFYMNILTEYYKNKIINNNQFVFLIRSAPPDQYGRFEILLHAGNIKSIENFYSFIKNLQKKQ